MVSAGSAPVQRIRSAGTASRTDQKEKPMKLPLPGGTKTRLAVIALPAIVAVGLMGAPASAQPAAVQPQATSTCPAGNHFFWVDANYNRAMGKVSGDNDSWTAFRQVDCNGGTWNDCASSFYNHGNYDKVYVYQNINRGGGSVCISKGTAWADLSQRVFSNGVGLNDQISSNAWGSDAVC
jgi:hypothetical protein